jgi:hypothetical protein
MEPKKTQPVVVSPAPIADTAKMPPLLSVKDWEKNLVIESDQMNETIVKLQTMFIERPRPEKVCTKKIMPIN